MLLAPALLSQEAPGFAPPSSNAAPLPEAPSTPDELPRSVAAPSSGKVDQDLPGAGADYDPAIFQSRIPKEQLATFVQYGSWRSGDVWKDKQFRKIAKQVIPDCTFHYGSDKSMETSMDEAFSGSADPAELHDGHYLLISGARGPYLGGRGFLWLDLQEGVGLGGFYFHPTNGEPTPTLTVFSRQIRAKALGMSDLPLPFAVDLNLWTEAEHIRPIATRYFIGGINRRLLLEHDEDYCAPMDGSVAPTADECQQMNADAADIDMNTAYYLKQINYATNGTAWMIVGNEQTIWISDREHTCGLVLGCRVHVTHEHIHVITGRPVRSPHPVPRPPGHAPQGGHK
jgi:hypothetical protein